MKIKLHGGDCCGVKHIHGLNHWPELSMAARKGTKMTSFGQKHPMYGHTMSGGHNDMMTQNPKKNCDFFCEAAPKESYEDRFKRFVDYIKSNRPHGIIEVVLNTTQPKWVPVLEKHGFKAVSSGTNSNSGCVITIYHLVY